MDTRAWIALLCLAGMTVGGLCYMAGKRRPRSGGRRNLAFKGGTTLIAAIPAAYAVLQGGGAAARWVLAAIILCAAADVILELRFEAGMAAFALGHLCFIAAFAAQGGIHAIHLLAWAALSLWALLYVRRAAKDMDKTPPHFLIYGVVIAAMLAASLTRGLLALSGAALFVLSDSLLLWNMLHPKGRRLGAAVMLSYWGAQYLLGLSVL